MISLREAQSDSYHLKKKKKNTNFMLAICRHLKREHRKWTSIISYEKSHLVFQEYFWQTHTGGRKQEVKRMMNILL